MYYRKVDLNERFSELKDFSRNKAKIRQAANKVVNPVLKPQHTMDDCWDLFLALTSLCSSLCLAAEDWSACITECYAAMGTTVTLCIVAAD